MSAPFQKQSIGTSALQLAVSSSVPRNGVMVEAHPGNASGSVVYVGFSGVTTGDGWPLGPGATVFVSNAQFPDPKNPDVNQIYVIGSTTGLIVGAWVI